MATFDFRTKDPGCKDDEDYYEFEEEVIEAEDRGVMGGFQAEQDANADIQLYLDSFVEDMGYETCEALKFRHQVVAGTMYLVKARCSDEDDNEEYVHVKIFLPLPSGESPEPEYKQHKTVESEDVELKPF